MINENKAGLQNNKGLPIFGSPYSGPCWDRTKRPSRFRRDVLTL